MSFETSDAFTGSVNFLLGCAAAAAKSPSRQVLAPPTRRKPKTPIVPLDTMETHRFTFNPFRDLHLRPEDRTKIVDITNALVLEKFEEYEDYLRSRKNVDLRRWIKSATSGPTTTYLEHHASSTGHSKLPKSLMVGPLPGSLDDNMFGIVNPTIEDMRIKTSYLHDFNAAAVLATIIEPSVEDPFRSVVIKWMEIDLPLASIGLVRNRDYVYIESTGILRLQSGDRVGYHLLHSASFPETPDLPHRVRGNLSFCAIFHQEGPNQTTCHGTGIMDPGGDLIRSMAIGGMVQATMAGLKYAYCGQMKKLAWLLEQRQTAARERGPPPVLNRSCATCMKRVQSSRFGGARVHTCKLCYQVVCRSCKVAKKLSFLAPDLALVQRKVTFCAQCLVEATRVDAQEAAREQFVYKKCFHLPEAAARASMSDPSTCSESSTDQGMCYDRDTRPAGGTGT
ncbi:hypothetical protein PsorP6_010357 [Peronosclerospora sorghi]|uniref:Uncharacterized protein n=1 Tax=Peronosclerospora sorghi TaxID=230839 RepID=A0ACC0VW99_9STRA|nr:hypothetical protein PsorP6_010357 [Peronosclerospora sorghi]